MDLYFYLFQCKKSRLFLLKTAFVTSIGSAGHPDHTAHHSQFAREGIRNKIPDLFSSFWDLFHQSLLCCVEQTKPEIFSWWIWFSSVFCHEMQHFGSDIWRCGSSEHQTFTVFWFLVVFGTGCSEGVWISHPWKSPGPGWMQFGAIWDSGRFPWQGVEQDEL